MPIEEDIQRLDIGNIVTLFTVDTTAIGGTEILRFTPSTDFGNMQNVVFDGETYAAIPCDATGFEYNGKGPIPTPTLTISNINGVLSSVVIEFNDLIGAPVDRIRVLEKYLDNGSNPDPTQTLPIDKFVIEQKTAQTPVFVEFTLASVLDQEGAKLPSRQALRSCTHRYRVFRDGAFDYTNATCPYVGAESFDKDGNPVADQFDSPSKKVDTCCQRRFGENNQLPGHFFPSIAKVR